MAIKKFFSNKQKPGWKWDAGKKQYFSWGYDINLTPVESDSTGKPKRNRRRESGFPSEALAAAAVARLIVEEKEGKFGFGKKTTTLAPVFRDLIEAKLPTLSHKHTRRIAETVLFKFSEFLPGGENTPIAAVTNAMMWKYIEHRLNTDKVTPETVNREMNAIASALHSADEFFPALKSWQSPKIARPKLTRKRRGQTWTPAEAAQLYQWLLHSEQRENETAGYFHCRLVVAQMFVFASLSAARVGELFKMRWADDVNLNSGWVRVVDWKTGGERFISPIPHTMETVLRRLFENKQSEFVFTRSGSIPTYFYETLRDGCRECGIRYGKKTTGGLRFHDLRHTATTALLAAGIDISTVQSITGHSDETMVLYYSHPSADSRTRAAAALDKSVEWASFGQDFNG